MLESCLVLMLMISQPVENSRYFDNRILGGTEENSEQRASKSRYELLDLLDFAFHFLSMLTDEEISLKTSTPSKSYIIVNASCAMYF